MANVQMKKVGRNVAVKMRATEAYDGSQTAENTP